MKFAFFAFATTSLLAVSAVPVRRGSPAKKGLGFNDVAATKAFANTVSWAYNWDSSKNGALTPGVEYVPLLFNAQPNHSDQWAKNAQAAIDSGSKYLLGFNEPDLPAQANMSPADAAAAWKKFMQPFAGKAKLVSPAVTNGAPPLGLGWLDDFLKACDGCQIDAIAIHIYDAANNVPYFQKYITDVGTKYKKPVWVTEFGATGSVADQQTFINTMVPFLDNLATVDRFNYFGDFTNTFVAADQSLLPLGKTYSTA